MKYETQQVERAGLSTRTLRIFAGLALASCVSFGIQAEKTPFDRNTQVDVTSSSTLDTFHRLQDRESYNDRYGIRPPLAIDAPQTPIPQDHVSRYLMATSF